MLSEGTKQTVFCAFPANPLQLKEDIARAIEIANSESKRLAFRGWPENDIAGRPIAEPILEKIEQACFIVADVTMLNFNVTYEIGFAIGVKKRAYLIRNKTFQPDDITAQKVGIFDTLGFVDYTDSRALAGLLNQRIDQTPLETNYALDRGAPVYLLETPSRSEAMAGIVSRVKKARLKYRSFNPSEDSRMAALEAVKHVASSHGVVVPLLSHSMRHASIHNIRAAFISGLAHGLEKPTLILGDREGQPALRADPESC